jgi:hypothetical protein
VIETYDFSGLDRLVDVGGGRGVLLESVVASAPGMTTGVLFDLPPVIAEAEARLAGTEIAARLELVGGDFFAEVPSGADAYLLSRVLHDWDDEAAHRILATCRAAMASGSRLVIADVVLPASAADNPHAIRMDLLMLLLLGGHERTEDAFRRLLAGAGFELTRVLGTSSPSGLAVLEAVPV